MSISVYEQLNNMGLNIDRATLQQVSQNILKRAEEKNSHYKVDNNPTYFQKRDIGIDLYNEKVDIKLANQIALHNTNLQINLNTDTLAKINYLNSMAAQNSGRNADGKIAITTSEINFDQKKSINNTNRITTNETAKDKNGSNPFYNGELLMTDKSTLANEDNQDTNKAITKSIFL